MANIVLAKIIAIYGPNYSYKNAVKQIKLAGGIIIDTAVTFLFPDSTTLVVVNK